MNLKYDAFKRSIILNAKNKKYDLFLGAGASIESGVKSAYMCIWDWKKSIYDTNNTSQLKLDICNEKTQEIVQKWLDKQGVFPPLNDPGEYSKYIELAYPQEEDRKAYFASIFKDKNPSIGYQLLYVLAEKCFFDKVWTTNFDDLLVKAARNTSFSVIDVTLDSTHRVNSPIREKQLMLIKLHGDYKYSELKNTEKEIQQQNNVLINKLKDSLLENDIIVIGYSGRDQSIMDSFKDCLKNDNAKNIYWCGLEKEPNSNVKNLIDFAESINKNVYYIQTPGFDNLIDEISFEICKDDHELLDKIEQIKKINPRNNELAKFEILDGPVKALVKSNILYYKLPLNCKSVEVPVDQRIGIQKKLKEIRKNNDICIEFYKGKLYFFGDYNIIKAHFLISEIPDNIPLSIELSRKNFIKILLKDLIIKSICKNNLDLDFAKDVIYDIKNPLIINNNQVYNGVKINLGENGAFNYISFSPRCYIPDSNLEKSSIKNINDIYFNNLYSKTPNFCYDMFLENWKNKIFASRNSVIKYNDTINIKFSKDFALAKIVNGNRKSTLSTKYNQNRIQFIANEVKDPLINFMSKDYRCITKDFHPMRGLINNLPYENAYRTVNTSDSINISVICPKEFNEKFYRFLIHLNRSHKVTYNIDYLIDYPGFRSIYKTNLYIPYYDEDIWREYQFTPTGDSFVDTKKLYELLIKEIDKIQELKPDSIVLIYVPDKFDSAKHFSSKNEIFDLHNQIKAYCVMKNIATQFINEKSLKDDPAAVFWTLSLALFVKSGKIPWSINEVTNSKTAFVGLGYSIDKSNSEKPIVLGCSHIFSGDGQALKYKLTKVKNPQFDTFDKNKENPFLDESEAYGLGCRINDICRKSFSIYPERVVIHKRTPFKKSEIEGLTKSLFNNGVKELELLEINFTDRINFIQLNQNLDADNFPVNRGLTIKLSDDTALLFTHGVAKSVRSEYYKYFLGGKSVPKPLLIKRYFGNTSLLQLSEEILALTRMNWNNFNMYSKLPCTIESSTYIAQIGYLLSFYDDLNFDQRLFM